MTDKTIRNFLLTTAEDTDVLHLNKASGDDRSITFNSFANAVLSKLPSDPNFYSLPTKGTLSNNDLLRLEGVGDDDKYQLSLNNLATFILNRSWPVGSVYNNKLNPTSPSTLFGVGTWVRERGRVLVGEGASSDINGASTSFTIGTTGGEYQVTLTESELPEHWHYIFANDTAFSFDTDLSAASQPTQVATRFDSSGNDSQYIMKSTSQDATIGATSEVGGSQSHNNIQPYFVAYTWVRVA